MHDFLLKELFNTNIEKELESIGFDKSYINKASDKFNYKNFKIYNLSCAQANIIKQTALTVGADCGTHREVITGRVEYSNCILGGSISQLKKIAQKLQFQPFNLKDLGIKLEKELNTSQTKKTKLIGILNITPDSFSDGGQYNNYNDAIKHLHKLIDDGADIIDIGAESTKPYSSAVPENQQIDKIKPILEYIKNSNIRIPISIDTRSSKVAAECIKLGANIINDVSGFDYDPQMPEIVAQNQDTKIIIQHSLGTPENMQITPKYDNLMDEIYSFLSSKINIALSHGIKKENIIIDPGIGFGKTREHNFEILRRWKELRTLGCPILIGLSRKSLLNMPNATNEEKDLYSLALNSILINNNIDYIRVHNIEIHKHFQELIY